MSNPSVPNIEGIDLAKVKADADSERDRAAALRHAQEEASLREAEAYVGRWHKAMNKTFKGISGGSSLDRRFRMRSEGKKMEREGR